MISINFIVNYAIEALSLKYPVYDDNLSDIFELAYEYELIMMDDNGNYYEHDYPEKQRNEQGCRFVTDVSGKWSELEPDLIDLNDRLEIHWPKK